MAEWNAWDTGLWLSSISPFPKEIPSIQHAESVIVFGPPQACTSTMPPLPRPRCSKQFHSHRFKRSTISAILRGQQHDLAHVAECTTDLHL